MYDTWEELEEGIKECQKCKLCKTRKNIVFGVRKQKCESNVHRRRTRSRRRYSSENHLLEKHGKLMDKAFQGLGIERKNVYIANIVKCRPPQNRNPEKDEADACIDYLRSQVKLVNPKIIVLLGSVALKNILGEQYGITASRGKWVELGRNFFHANLASGSTFKR